MTELSNRVHSVLASTAFRLAAVTVAVFVIIAAGLIAVLFWQTNRVLTDQVLVTLRAEAEALQTESQANGPSGLIEAVAARSRPEGPGLYFLADASGRKLAGNLSRTPPEIAADQQGGVFRYRPPIALANRDRLGVALALTLPRGERVIIGRDIEDQRAFADGVKRLFLLSFGALALGGLVTGVAISRIVLKRIEGINATSREIMAGDLSRRVPLEGSGDELDGLAGNLNAMLERIEQLMAGLREVSDNIAHDLKTPLNRLRNRAEAALRDPGGEHVYREGLERTIEDADDLIKTFNALLLIARLEAGALDKTAEVIDVGDLVDDCAELYAPVAEEAGLRLAVTTVPGIFIEANRQLIGQAVTNLIDNAIKYGRPAVSNGTVGTITIDVAATVAGITIAVADQGLGIAAGDRERALKRFVRLEESRTQPGTGLGLSLVAAVARLHGGQVTLGDNHPGLRVLLALPRQRATAAPVTARVGYRLDDASAPSTARPRDGSRADP